MIELRILNEQSVPKHIQRFEIQQFNISIYLKTERKIANSSFAFAPQTRFKPLIRQYPFVVQKIRPLYLLYFWMLTVVASAQVQQLQTPFEKTENHSATYAETIEFYETLVNRFPHRLRMTPTGETDAGEPLHTVVLSADGIFQSEQARCRGKVVLLINNGIHAGEPCGVDATQLLYRDYLTGELPLPENVVLVAIPFYNVGGALNRGSFSRANQNGPTAHGFRGNAKNLDLNRDFIKTDSRNARTFQQIFNDWQPDIFVDNHTSNGADYQYTITLIATQKDKLPAPAAGYLTEGLLPHLYTEMATTPYEMTPYVYSNGPPDKGIYAFLDLPRFSTGYAALHGTIGFMPETHMLKPFPDRVRSVYHFMRVLVDKMNADRATLGALKKRSTQFDRTQTTDALNWTVDTTRVDSVTFRGYTADYKPSSISGQPRLFYDRDRPWTRTIPLRNSYRSTVEVERPFAYVIPQAYRELVGRLRMNGVEVLELKRDFLLTGTYYYIDDYQTRDQPYENHYLHSNVQVRRDTQTNQFRAGDFVVIANQDKVRFLTHVLEPQAPDSYFAWNFFDGILQQKEYFSSYVFEERAEELLKVNPELAQRLEARRAADPEFAKSGRAQLDFIYKNSPHYERTHNRYPVLRLEEAVDLPVE